MNRGALLAATLLAAIGAHVQAASPPVLEAVFSPWDDVEGRLLQLLAGARKTVRVQAFLFTSRPLARALIAAHRRGVNVAVLADREMVSRGNNSQIPILAAAGIPVWLETGYASAHNKILLIDAAEADCVVATGSYNYTFSAQARNAENVLIVRGDRELARSYQKNWQRHRDDALPLVEALPP